jgi:tRNA A37 threonylcarbamoyladenosine dehydratase
LADGFFTLLVVVTKDWKQDVIEAQTALVFGAGGIGSNIAASLCRLGIAKLFIIDNVCARTSSTIP